MASHWERDCLHYQQKILKKLTNITLTHWIQKDFLKAVKTSCQSVGHSEEAAKYAKQKCFAMLDFFGLNSLFWSTTPDDECSFRVRLYTKLQNWVSVQNPSKYSDPKYFDNPFTQTKTQYSRNLNILSICILLISFSNRKSY
jgi:hypothetical protein